MDAITCGNGNRPLLIGPLASQGTQTLQKKKKCTREQTVTDGKEYPKGSNSILKELMIKKLTQAWWSAKAGLQKVGPGCTGTQ